MIIPNTSYYEDINYWWNVPWLKSYAKSLFAWIEPYLLNNFTLEIGAANGDFLNLVPDCNVTIYNDLKDLSREEYRFNRKFIGPIEQFYDDLFLFSSLNVLMIDVIEHLENPFEIFNKLPVNSRYYIITADGDAIHRHNEMMEHVEHSVIITQKAFQICSKLYNYKIVDYIKTPFGLSVIIIDK